MKKNLFILCLLAALVLPMNAVAQHHHHHYPGPSRRELPPCATAEQMQAVMQTLKGQFLVLVELRRADGLYLPGYAPLKRIRVLPRRVSSG